MTKRIFAVVIAIAMVCTMFAFVTSAAETTRVTLDASVTEYGWDQILNALNMNNYDKDADWKQAAGDAGANVKALAIYCYLTRGWQPGDSRYNSQLYTEKINDLITEGASWIGDKPSDDVRFCDYFQNTFGYVAYGLRGGKQRAVDLWNSLCDLPVALDGDYAYTYTNNTKYTSESYNAALNALKAYMVQAQDNYVCNTATDGRWTKQKERYAALENALNALVEGTPEVVTTTTKTLNTASNYTWHGYLNVVNVIPDTETEGLRAAGTPYKVFLTEMLAIMNDPNAGAASDAAYMNSYAMSDGVLLKDYVQDTYGAYAYVLRGGRQKAADYWNSKLSVALTLGNNSYTYTNAGAQDAYDATAYQAAVDALNAYMANTADSSCFDVENGGGRYYDQKAKYEALVAAVDACAATAVQTLVDFTGVTSTDSILTWFITLYNNVDIESIKADADVQNWAKCLKDGILAGKSKEDIFVGDTNIVTVWENLIRDIIKLSNGALTAADAVFNDSALWPLGAVIKDLNQTTYKTAQYNEVYNLWVQIRDDYRKSTTVKTSEVLAACESLKAKIQALEVANLPFTPEQKDACSVLKTYVPYYRARVERIVLDSNKATDIYKNYVALVVKAEGYIALDWENGTSESYPSVEEMHALIMPEAMGGSLELDWYPFRQAFGLDNNGYDTLLKNTYTAWVESGKYTEASLADVKARIDNLEAAKLSGNRGSNNTDAGAQEDIEYYQAFLVEKPALPPFKVKTVSLSLSDSIAIHFKVDVSVYEAYENVYAMISCDGDVKRVEGVLGSDGRYWFSYRNLTPNMAKVPVEMTLYGTGNGQEYTKTVSYSIYKYCQSLYNNQNTNDKVKTFIVDFLNYAAALQEYTNYKVDDLANVGFDQSYASATLTAPVNQLNGRVATIDNPTVAWKGLGLSIKDVINTRVKFKTDDITGLSIRFTINGTDYNVTEFTPVEGTENQYYAYFGKTLPNEMRTTFTFTAYRDGVAVSNTAQYSIQSYAAQVGVDTTTSLGKVLDAMLKYGDSCAVAFG